MLVDISVDKTAKLLSAKLSGPVTVDSFLEALEGVLAERELPAGFGALIDLRDAAHGASSDDIGRLGNHLATEPALQGSRAAIVVSRTVTYGLMRMLQMHMDGAPMTVSVFYDMDEAKRWLGMSLS